jgi:hypothetical protein
MEKDAAQKTARERKAEETLRQLHMEIQQRQRSINRHESRQINAVHKQALQQEARVVAYYSTVSRNAS